MKNESFKEAIIYHIFIDRFSGYKENLDWEKPIFCGGNIKGIIKKIPYLKNLGINTIWISPPYKGFTYHGYHTEDFFKIDERFGSINDFKLLIKELHKENIKLILDFVPNHCSSRHPFFIDAQKNKNSKYRKWFYFKNWPNEYLRFLSIDELPKLNLDNKETRGYMTNCAKYWLSLGIDGYRFDHVVGPSHNFWKEFNKEIKKEYPDTILIGEVRMDDISFRELETINIRNKYFKWLLNKLRIPNEQLLKEYIREMDGVLDMEFYSLIDKYIAKNYNPIKLKSKLRKHYKKYPKNYFLPTFLDNHDEDRFLFRCKSKNKLMKAASIQFKINQPKIIYYGTEIGMTQKKSKKSRRHHGDIYAREPMKWKDIDKNLLNFYKKLIKSSKNN